MPRPPISARRWLINGRVQGVGFRYFVEQAADQLSLTGYARNLADGRVEAVFEGEPAAVDTLLAWCRAGPRHARVDSVEVREETPEGLSGFEVR